MDQERRRRLAAVWFADIAGYTELSAHDEDGALAVVDELQEISRSAVGGRGGRIVKFQGDAVLCVFDSTDGAIRAAQTLQRSFRESELVREKGVALRIGVHIGEVVEADDGDVYGDGVNLAARLEGFSQPGEIVVSEDVYRQVRQRKDIDLTPVGAVELKGMPEPITIYSIGGSGRPTPRTDEQEDGLKREVQRALGADFEVRAPVGRGGFGTVFSAWDKILEREVAVKAIRPEHSTAQSLERFRREARTIAKLEHHPNIVGLHHFKEGARLACIIMPMIPGHTLQSRIDADEVLTPAEASQAMSDVAKGLQEAHDHGITHRDMKPSNIMFDERLGHWRIMDFGLARDPMLSSSAVTFGGFGVGTPLYMAPEQAEDPSRADHRADIYSFGATFYHAVTGRPPFTGASGLAVLVKHKMDPLEAPQSVNPAIPDSLNDCLERCLAKHPADRLQSLRDVLELIGGSSASAWDLDDDPALRSTLERFKRSKDTYLNGSDPDRAAESFVLPNGRSLSITWGDITEQEVDAIVSSDDHFVTMSGGVSRSIWRRGGQAVYDQARSLVPVRPGRAVVTGAGDLRCRFVFHGVTLGTTKTGEGDAERFVEIGRPSRDLISDIVDSCFVHADALWVRSMAFPLLGTGTGGFPRDVCLDTLFRALIRRLHRGLTTVKDVRIVIWI